jgi:hypothetical protein
MRSFNARYSARSPTSQQPRMVRQERASFGVARGFRRPRRRDRGRRSDGKLGRWFPHGESARRCLLLSTCTTWTIPLHGRQSSPRAIGDFRRSPALTPPWCRRPGEFYLRELPALRAVLPCCVPLAFVVVDGYVDLDPGRPARPGRPCARRVQHPGDWRGQERVQDRNARRAGRSRALSPAFVHHRRRHANTGCSAPGRRDGRNVPLAGRTQASRPARPRPRTRQCRGPLPSRTLGTRHVRVPRTRWTA